MASLPSRAWTRVTRSQPGGTGMMPVTWRRSTSPLAPRLIEVGMPWSLKGLGAIEGIASEVGSAAVGTRSLLDVMEMRGIGQQGVALGTIGFERDGGRLGKELGREVEMPALRQRHHHMQSDGDGALAT